MKRKKKSSETADRTSINSKKLFIMKNMHSGIIFPERLVMHSSHECE
jgi:hypothetical protein